MVKLGLPAPLVTVWQSHVEFNAVTAPTIIYGSKSPRSPQSFGNLIAQFFKTAVFSFLICFELQTNQSLSQSNNTRLISGVTYRSPGALFSWQLGTFVGAITKQ